MGTTHALQLEGANDVGGELLGVRQRHAHHAVRLRPAARPVLNTQQYFYIAPINIFYTVLKKKSSQKLLKYSESKLIKLFIFLPHNQRIYRLKKPRDEV